MDMEQGSANNFSENVDALFTNLESFTKSDTVMGNPVSHEGKTFIPIISVTVGYGSGYNPSKKQNNTGTTGMGMMMGMDALGLGAKVTTEAVLLIENNNVSVLPINGKTNLMDKIPQIMSNFGMGNQQNQQQGQQGQQQ